MKKRIVKRSKRKEVMQTVASDSHVGQRFGRALRSSERLLSIHIPSTRSQNQIVQKRSNMVSSSVPTRVRLFHSALVALCIGIVGVFGSVVYYVRVAEATKSLRSDQMVVSEAVEPSVEIEPMEELPEATPDDSVEISLRPPPQEYLRERAEHFGYDASLLNTIAYCESRWQMVKNRQSSAYGYFQIIDGTERLTPQYNMGLRKTDPYVNIDMALYLYGKYGTAPWYASMHCWSRR